MTTSCSGPQASWDDRKLLRDGGGKLCLDSTNGSLMLILLLLLVGGTRRGGGGGIILGDDAGMRMALAGICTTRLELSSMKDEIILREPVLRTVVEVALAAGLGEE